MPVYQYLDLSTSHLTEREMSELTSPFSFGDLDHSPRVVAHDYGAWVNVPELLGSGGSWSEDDATALRESRPNLAAVLDYARSKGCTWVNLDQDASTEDLPVFDW